MHKLKSVVIFFLALSSTHIQSQSNTFTITGNVKGLKGLEYVELEKYISFFEKKAIAKIPIINNHFFYSDTAIKEIDAYIIKSPDNQKLAYWFIWDNHIKIDIDTTSYFARASDSPMTQLRDSCSKIMEDSYLKNIHVLDTLISITKKDNKSRNEILELENRKKIAFQNASNGLRSFTENFIRTNPNSFLSLFYLTETGLEQGDIWNKNMYAILSERLKNHSRAKQFKE